MESTISPVTVWMVLLERHARPTLMNVKELSPRMEESVRTHWVLTHVNVPVDSVEAIVG